MSIWVDLETEAELDRVLFPISGDGGTDRMPGGDYGVSRRFAGVDDRFGVSWQLNVAAVVAAYGAPPGGAPVAHAATRGHGHAETSRATLDPAADGPPGEGDVMGEVRYGARPVVAQSNREVEATRGSDLVQGGHDRLPHRSGGHRRRPATALSSPWPRQPGSASTWSTWGPASRSSGAGWFGVRARHGDVEGEYALFMPMSTEQATIGGRETFGEPKKIAQLHLYVDGDSLTAGVGRGLGNPGGRGVRHTRPKGPGYEIDKLDFYFKLLPNPSGVGLDGDPALVYCRRHETARVVRAGHRRMQAPSRHPWTRLPTSHLDEVLSSEYAEISSSQAGEIVEFVPAEWLTPFVHQRYDDLKLLLGADR